MITFSNHLEIRCAYARALVLEQIHGERAEIVQEAFLDVRDAAIIAGSQDYDNDNQTPPTMFANSPLLIDAWECGHAMAMEYSYSSKFDVGDE